MSRARRAALSLLLAPLALVVAPPQATAEWSRFRGPNGGGTIEASGLPVELGPESNVVWRTEVPFGRSSPAVGERQIFLTAVDGDRMVVLALNRADGAEIWRRELARGHEAELYRQTDSATPSPVTDGSNVYAFFHETGLVSFDAAGGERWRRPLGPFRNYYGIAASPILAGDRLLMLCDQARGSFLLALDKDTGEELWRRNRPARLESYATPILAADGTVLVLGSRWVDAYDPATGKALWSLSGLGTGPVASPTLAGDLLFATFPDHAPQPPPPFSQMAAEHDANGDGELARDELEGSWIQNHYNWVNVDGSGGISADDWRAHTAEVVNDASGLFAVRLPEGERRAEIVWNYRKNVPYVPSPLVHDGVLYVVADGIVSSLDPATGELHKRGRLGNGSPKVLASPIVADGKIYIATRDGQVAVLAPGPQFEVLSLNDLDEQIHATPAVADDRLLVRTRGSLYAFAAPPAVPTTSVGGR